MFKRLSLVLIIYVFSSIAVNTAMAETENVRVGHFPNVTHAPALIARAKNHFETSLGKEVRIEWKIFNAGPEAVEALFAGAIDMLYVGPNPAVNGFVRSQGDALRIIAGVASGGSGFVIRENSEIRNFEDIRGKRVATPQRGNSQDVAFHHQLFEKGLKPKTKGGDVEVFHISGGDQITAFEKEQVDGIWTVEPWLTRLVSEAHGKILFEESDLWPDGIYATTVLAARRKFIQEKPELVQKWVRAHVEVIDWIESHYTEAKRLFNEEFEREAGKPLPPAYLDRFFTRITFTYDSMQPQILRSAEHAFQIGYLGKEKSDLTNLYELSFLNLAIAEREQKNN